MATDVPGSPIRADRKRRFDVLTAAENEEQTMLALVERLAGGRLLDITDEAGGLVYTKPQTFGEICQELDVPYTRFLTWLQADDARWSLFLKAKEAASIHYVDEAVGIADSDSPYVQRDRLRVETRFRYAKHYAPGLFGERISVDGGPAGALVDAALMGAASELLKRIKAPATERVIEHGESENAG